MRKAFRINSRSAIALIVQKKYWSISLTFYRLWFSLYKDGNHMYLDFNIRRNERPEFEMDDNMFDMAYEIMMKWRFGCFPHSKNYYFYVRKSFCVSRENLRDYWRERLTFLIDAVSLRDVHYWVSSTDCDHYHTEHAEKYLHIFEARKSIDRSYQWADGPIYYSRISRKEYEELKNESIERDYVLEAFEDGHPHSVRG